MRILAMVLVTALATPLLAPTSAADVLQIPLSQQGDNKTPRPGKGMTKAEVEKLFGAPETSAGPVGTPPITRWQYPEYVVIFEYDHVVHTVLKHKPKAPIEQTEATEPEPAQPQSPR
jgi:hypothetical protein